VDPAPLWEVLAEKALVIHNAAFDLGFLARLGFAPTGKVHCTLTLSRLLYAGDRAEHGLAACLARELGIALDKTEQSSDWAGPLTQSQLAYATRDVLHLRPLLEALEQKIHQARLNQVACIETRCLPAIAWMAAHGVAVDRQTWLRLVDEACADATRLKQEMADLAPKRAGEMFGSWHWDSSADMRLLFQTLGFEVLDTCDETLARIDHPLAGRLRAYRAACKLASTYGKNWANHITSDGRVYPRWNQTQSAAGRMSCSHPNMQQLPRDRAYRQCVIAPPGRVLVKADYSQIELRIAARVSKDPTLTAGGSTCTRRLPSASSARTQSARKIASWPRRSTSACSTAWVRNGSARMPGPSMASP
jgi:DNA polymerase-1